MKSEEIKGEIKEEIKISLWVDGKLKEIEMKYPNPIDWDRLVNSRAWKPINSGRGGKNV